MTASSSVPERRTYTVPEAAVVLGISRSQYYELAAQGEVPSLRVGRRLVVPIDALNQYIDKGDSSSPPIDADVTRRVVASHLAIAMKKKPRAS